MQDDESQAARSHHHHGSKDEAEVQEGGKGEHDENMADGMGESQTRTPALRSIDMHGLRVIFDGRDGLTRLLVVLFVDPEMEWDGALFVCVCVCVFVYV